MAYERQMTPVTLPPPPPHVPMATWKKALIIFIALTIFVSGAIVFMAIVGWLGLDKHGKDIWVEVNSQILNACFTFVAVVMHPMRLRCLFHMLRFRSTGDSKHLLAIQKDFPNVPLNTAEEQLRFFKIIILFNVNSTFQYPIVVAMWGYKYDVRPNAIIIVFLPLAMIAGTVAGIWQALIERRYKKELAALATTA
ncbi:Aste57867_25103 [Aphanomyces stellatus]|uniref:Aste57867_25103 protein n=1 Tax=Aphanomyces stellatus TaxID=120398 RepID=A0A485LTL5_9STRA|nr:hypothetical protein As57867_025025 [Aphanomyces stellatus]VFU01734.1 Aste57867_25103 [Aphanomyces stellatus]